MNRRILHYIGMAVIVQFVLTSCGESSSQPPTSMTETRATPTEFVAEVWADNWFELWVNGVKVGEDSVPITTERSFNAETISFVASYPLTVAMMTKDYKENETGLEYIGKPNQQIGDGGFIAQITDKATGKVVLGTSKAWTGLVVQTAPLNPTCETSTDPARDCQHEERGEPTGWRDASFDESGWSEATEYTATEVGTKDGYDTISWAPVARLIWSSDLKLHNTILWRAPTVEQ